MRATQEGAGAEELQQVFAGAEEGGAETVAAQQAAAIAALQQHGFPRITPLAVEAMNVRITTHAAAEVSEVMINPLTGALVTSALWRHPTAQARARPLPVVTATVYERLGTPPGDLLWWDARYVPIVGDEVYHADGTPMSEQELRRAGLRKMRDRLGNLVRLKLFVAGGRVFALPGPWVVPYVYEPNGIQILTTLRDIQERADGPVTFENLAEALRRLAGLGRIHLRFAATWEFKGIGAWDLVVRPGSAPPLARFARQAVYIPAADYKTLSGRPDNVGGGVGAIGPAEARAVDNDRALRREGAALLADTVVAVPLLDPSGVPELTQAVWVAGRLSDNTSRLDDVAMMWEATPFLEDAMEFTPHLQLTPSFTRSYYERLLGHTGRDLQQAVAALLLEHMARNWRALRVIGKGRSPWSDTIGNSGPLLELVDTGDETLRPLDPGPETHLLEQSGSQALRRIGRLMVILQGRLQLDPDDTLMRYLLNHPELPRRYFGALLGDAAAARRAWEMFRSGISTRSPRGGREHLAELSEQFLREALSTGGLEEAAAVAGGLEEASWAGFGRRDLQGQVVAWLATVRPLTSDVLQSWMTTVQRRFLEAAEANELTALREFLAPLVFESRIVEVPPLPEVVPIGLGMTEVPHYGDLYTILDWSSPTHATIYLGLGLVEAMMTRDPEHVLAELMAMLLYDRYRAWLIEHGQSQEPRLQESIRQEQAWLVVQTAGWDALARRALGIPEEDDPALGQELERRAFGRAMARWAYGVARVPDIVRRIKVAHQQAVAQAAARRESPVDRLFHDWWREIAWWMDEQERLRRFAAFDRAARRAAVEEFLTIGVGDEDPRVRQVIRQCVWEAIQATLDPDATGTWLPLFLQTITTVEGDLEARFAQLVHEVPSLERRAWREALRQLPDLVFGSAYARRRVEGHLEELDLWDTVREQEQVVATDPGRQDPVAHAALAEAYRRLSAIDEQREQFDRMGVLDAQAECYQVLAESLAQPSPAARRPSYDAWIGRLEGHYRRVAQAWGDLERQRGLPSAGRSEAAEDAQAEYRWLMVAVRRAQATVAALVDDAESAARYERAATVFEGPRAEVGTAAQAVGSEEKTEERLSPMTSVEAIEFVRPWPIFEDHPQADASLLALYPVTPGDVVVHFGSGMSPWPILDALRGGDVWAFDKDATAVHGVRIWVQVLGIQDAISRRGAFRCEWQDVLDALTEPRRAQVVVAIDVVPTDRDLIEARAIGSSFAIEWVERRTQAIAERIADLVAPGGIVLINRGSREADEYDQAHALRVALTRRGVRFSDEDVTQRVNRKVADHLPLWRFTIAPLHGQVQYVVHELTDETGLRYQVVDSALVAADRYPGLAILAELGWGIVIDQGDDAIETFRTTGVQAVDYFTDEDDRAEQFAARAHEQGLSLAVTPYTPADAAFPRVLQQLFSQLSRLPEDIVAERVHLPTLAGWLEDAASHPAGVEEMA